MQLKSFQNRVLRDIRAHLARLATERDRRHTAIRQASPETMQVARDYDFPARAWEGEAPYRPAQTGDGEPVPDITVKVPTGGGKTLIACHAIGEIQRLFLRNVRGLVVWMVPSTQIYRQTLSALRERDHPYRVALENTIGVGPDDVKIVQREEPLSTADLARRLTVLLLMLPAANGKTTQALRMYRDAGSYAQFFPGDDDDAGHARLAGTVSNLDTFAHGLLPVRVQTSLANLMRINRPLIVVDEGHKAYSPNARKTILGFNPSLILQLTATPRPQANVLTGASGIDLDREEMVKIPIHVTPARDESDWTETMLRAKNERDRLETAAEQNRQNTGRHIRPICLVQVERTGKDQLASGLIHSEQVKKYLVAHCSVPDEQVAIKSSDKDDIEGIDLLSENSPIRYIITKQALQEGWDCSFAYILVVLTNPTSVTGMTQLLGRVLRQPDAKRTGVPVLNTSRVFSYRARADVLLSSIKNDLEREGLGDLGKRVFADDGEKAAQATAVAPKLRGRYKKYDGRLFLPIFSARRRGRWAPIDYEADILAFVDWDALDGTKIASGINLADKTQESDYLKHLPHQEPEEIEPGDDRAPEVDHLFFARDLTMSVPNAWRAWDLAHQILADLFARHEEGRVHANFVHILEESRKMITGIVDTQCESIFRDRLGRGEIRFRLLEHDMANALRKIRPAQKTDALEVDGGTPAKALMNLYDRHDFNQFERNVAICLEKQAKLLWWHRMATGAGYRIQGWRRHKVHPDFLAARKPRGSETPANIFVIETKGLHLKNEDTDYKKSLFDLCNLHTPISKNWSDLGLGFNEHVFEFRVVYSDEWENTLNGLFE